MKALVTGSAGHLGEAMVRTLRGRGVETEGLDIKASPFTSRVGSITDRRLVASSMKDVRVVYHTATLHKPHIATHSKQQFIDTNVTGTLTLLEAAHRVGVDAFVFTSTTSVFGAALKPPYGHPATWVTEELSPIPKNIYGVSKTAAEELCHLFHRTGGLSCVVLRTSRFFPEEDDDRLKRAEYDAENLKVNEFLFRRVDLQDVVSAHLAAADRAPALGFGRYIVSATSPFTPDDLAPLRYEAAKVVGRHVSAYRTVYQKLGWKMFGAIDRVYINQAARQDLGWSPKIDFAHVIDCLEQGKDFRSPLARAVGSKGYHARDFEDGPYPVVE